MMDLYATNRKIPIHLIIINPLQSRMIAFHDCLICGTKDSWGNLFRIDRLCCSLSTCFHMGWVALGSWFKIWHAVSVTPIFPSPAVIMRFQSKGGGGKSAPGLLLPHFSSAVQGVGNGQGQEQCWKVPLSYLLRAGRKQGDQARVGKSACWRCCYPSSPQSPPGVQQEWLSSSLTLG